MLTEIYIEALLVDEEAADHVWEAWDKGKSTILLLPGRGGRLLLRCKLSTPRGAVAQLGERRVRNAKVGSSILLGSNS